MTQEHIVSSFDEELNRLRSKIVLMGNIVTEQFREVALALESRDEELAKKIRANDKVIDDLEIEVEQTAIQLIALRAPVADDLREVISAIKISSALERMGDYAKNLAKRITVLSHTKDISASSTIIQQMIVITCSMISDILDAYIAKDTAKAIDVWNRDQEIDSLNDSLFRELLTYMMEKPRYITPATHLLFISKNIERAGDHATNIAEIIYYINEGEQLDHKRPKKDYSSFANISPDDKRESS